MKFAVIYQFNVIQGKEEQFLSSWKRMTELIYEFENSFGSRLHTEKNGSYIAYALWPDSKTWENAGHHLPIEAEQLRHEMRSSCHDVQTLFEMEIQEDLLQTTQFNP